MRPHATVFSAGLLSYATSFTLPPNTESTKARGTWSNYKGRRVLRGLVLEGFGASEVWCLKGLVLEEFGA